MPSKNKFSENFIWENRHRINWNFLEIEKLNFSKDFKQKIEKFVQKGNKK